MEADVSLSLDACTWVLFTMFCTLTLISCMVLVTSSIRGGLQTDFGRFIRSACHLRGGAGDLRRRITNVLHQFSQTFDHAAESVAQCVLLGPGNNFDGEIASCNCL